MIASRIEMQQLPTDFNAELARIFQEASNRLQGKPLKDVLADASNFRGVRPKQGPESAQSL